jgi:hypothetical protein
MRLKFFDIKHLAKISQNWKKIILLPIFSSQTFTQTRLYPYEVERFSQHVISKYHQCSKCLEERTLHSTLTRTQKAHSQRALPILKTALRFYKKFSWYLCGYQVGTRQVSHEAMTLAFLEMACLHLMGILFLELHKFLHSGTCSLKVSRRSLRQ